MNMQFGQKRNDAGNDARARRALTWKTLLISTLISLLIGGLIAMTGSSGALPQQLLVSVCIGLSIWTLAQAGRLLTRDRLPTWLTLLIAVPVGLVIGGRLASLFGAYDFVAVWYRHPVEQWQSIVVSLLFAFGASVIIALFTYNSEYRLELEQERRRGAESSQAQVQAQLALLQAQIEPHFLFNTLAHVVSAIESDPAAARTMLEQLTRYLRATLRRSHQADHRLAEEIELIEALLSIAAMRLGPRLRYDIKIDPALHALQLPPLLLQPLVENAIKHGIEPALGGGEIRVDSEVTSDEIRLRVTDTGVGLIASAPEGVGLSNVRARLRGLYGLQGRLSLSAHPQRGVVAQLHLPLQLARQGG
jgi:signal transduction histidine kinase